MIANNILELIGGTPMIRINHINPNPKIEVLAKLERFNPTGSIKDRVALKMIEEAEFSGELKSGKIIIEASSGNSGIGLAMIGKSKNYKVLIVMSSSVSVERQQMITAYGADILLTSAELGTDGAILKARELVRENPDKFFYTNQFSNENVKLAHYQSTGQEIWKQTNGKVTHFIAALGTSGTLMGVGKALKEKNPNIKIIAAHPVKGHNIQGLVNLEESIIPDIFDPNLINKTIMIESNDAFEMARKIVAEESIFIGMSSGAAMVAALKIIPEINEGCIVVIFPDGGEKYLSTKLFNK